MRLIVWHVNFSWGHSGYNANKNINTNFSRSLSGFLFSYVLPGGTRHYFNNLQKAGSEN